MSFKEYHTTFFFLSSPTSAACVVGNAIFHYSDCKSVFASVWLIHYCFRIEGALSCSNGRSIDIFFLGTWLFWDFHYNKTETKTQMDCSSLSHILCVTVTARNGRAKRQSLSCGFVSVVHSIRQNAINHTFRSVAIKIDYTRNCCDPPTKKMDCSKSISGHFCLRHYHSMHDWEAVNEFTMFFDTGFFFVSSSS